MQASHTKFHLLSWTTMGKDWVVVLLVILSVAVSLIVNLPGRLSGSRKWIGKWTALAGTSLPKVVLKDLTVGLSLSSSTLISSVTLGCFWPPASRPKPRTAP